MNRGDQETARFSAIPSGGTSLLVVFAVLCLTVFALLSLATVQADLRLADASAQSVRAYYAADCRAQELLARLKSGEFPEGVYLEGEHYVFELPISGSQKLAVELAGDFTVLRWQQVSSKAWEADESLDLWDGDGTRLGID